MPVQLYKLCLVKGVIDETTWLTFKRGLRRPMTCKDGDTKRTREIKLALRSAGLRVGVMILSMKSVTLISQKGS